MIFNFNPTLIKANVQKNIETKRNRENVAMKTSPAEGAFIP